MIPAEISKTLASFIKRNSPTILTGVGVSGTVGVGYLSGKAGYAAAGLIESVERESGKSLSLKEKIKLTWDLYIPAAAVGGTTIAAILSANRIGSARTAAITAAYSLSEKAFYEYREKVGEVVGANKTQAIHDAYVQDKIDATPPPAYLPVTEGQVLCCELYTGRYFESDMETLKKAVNEVNALMISGRTASLSAFYYEIDLPTTSASDILGWDSDRMLELVISTAITDRGKPCLTFDYNYIKDI